MCKQIQPDGSEAFALAGVASFTAKEVAGDFPGAFARIDPFVDWIEKTLNNN